MKFHTSVGVLHWNRHSICASGYAFQNGRKSTSPYPSKLKVSIEVHWQDGVGDPGLGQHSGPQRGAHGNQPPKCRPEAATPRSAAASRWHLGGWSSGARHALLGTQICYCNRKVGDHVALHQQVCIKGPAEEEYRAALTCYKDQRSINTSDQEGWEALTEFFGGRDLKEQWAAVQD